MTKKKIKVYELDFGDTNFISEDVDAILEWISTAMKDMKGDDELEYKITTKQMTREEIDALPEWS